MSTTATLVAAVPHEHLPLEVGGFYLLHLDTRFSARNLPLCPSPIVAVFRKVHEEPESDPNESNPRHRLHLCLVKSFSKNDYGFTAVVFLGSRTIPTPLPTNQHGFISVDPTQPLPGRSTPPLQVNRPGTFGAGPLFINSISPITVRVVNDPATNGIIGCLVPNDPASAYIKKIGRRDNPSLPFPGLIRLADGSSIVRSASIRLIISIVDGMSRRLGKMGLLPGAGMLEMARAGIAPLIEMGLLLLEGVL
ncbi:hypothetical protein BDK51DRAFT_48536 [Blyttiomyces helicus]|uniref:Uncharacterized protein n=1 Tax=Blyttiomyces helicus TaxID=388810 RepID=A0A4P9W1Z4_9FUNG|nr:hypothetical protein BDK51DRAFT_48536 [Blyttiomyces helicus]|eukprot:RKO85722.1 hypothetical protein BDK51DRAFT_48536 [Blyttiomyces helicus]